MAASTLKSAPKRAKMSMKWLNKLSLSSDEISSNNIIVSIFILPFILNLFQKDYEIYTKKLN